MVKERATQRAKLEESNMMSPTDSDRETEQAEHLQGNVREQTKLQLMRALVENQDPSSKVFTSSLIT